MTIEQINEDVKEKKNLLLSLMEIFHSNKMILDYQLQKKIIKIANYDADSVLSLLKIEKGSEKEEIDDSSDTFQYNIPYEIEGLKKRLDELDEKISSVNNHLKSIYNEYKDRFQKQSDCMANQAIEISKIKELIGKMNIGNGVYGK